LKSAGSLMRKVKGTASFSGPSMTAIFAPAGNADDHDGCNDP
jgi:hypothetical protein